MEQITLTTGGVTTPYLKLNKVKSIQQQLLDAKLFGEDKAEIQRLQQLLNEEDAYRVKDDLVSEITELSKEMYSGVGKSGRQIIETTNELRNLLLRKNKAYGNSALEPLNVFSQQNAVDSLCARLDDKLSRIKNKGLNDKTEDTLFDLAGYLILLIIAKNEQE